MSAQDWPTYPPLTPLTSFLWHLADVALLTAVVVVGRLIYVWLW